MKSKKRTVYHRLWRRRKLGVPLEQPVRGTEDFLLDPNSIYRHPQPVKEVKVFCLCKHEEVDHDEPYCLVCDCEEFIETQR